MEPLSKREYQVADLIHQGYIEKEIAYKIHVSYETVRTHAKNIRRKLNARNIADITRIFILDLSAATRVGAMVFFLAIQAYTMVLANNDMVRPQGSRVVRVQRTRKNKRD